MPKNEIAIIMAAGLGTRMSPLTLKVPKPLVRVFGIPMIETLIMGLHHRGISEIYIVVGYLKERFQYLKEKYSGVTLIENAEYASKNNISSIYAVHGIMGSSDCFICEADLFVSDQSIFDDEFDFSCYYGKSVSGHTDDWVFHTVDDRITRIRKGGDNLYKMVGISYFKKNDAKRIADAIRSVYKEANSANLFWDEVVDRELNSIYVVLHKIRSDQVIEIDTFRELMVLDNSYRNLLP